MAALASCAVLVAPRSAAEEPFEVTWEIDVPVVVAGFALGGSLQLMKEELVTTRCSPHCVDAHVNALDRTTVGQYSKGAAIAGDVVVGINLGLPLLLGAIDTLSSDRSAAALVRDTLILAETSAITVAIHQMTAFTSQRPRPYAYNPNLDPSLLSSANSYLSFYSGHTANSFAMASAYSYMFTVRHPSSHWTPAVWTLTHGLAAFEGYTRVTSGFHFWTDVLVGAAMGSTVGLVVPWLHRRAGSVRRAWYLLPMVSGDSAGAALSYSQ